jgi:proline iminopeptidase
MRKLCYLFLCTALFACNTNSNKQAVETNNSAQCSYFNNNDTGVLSGGVRMIPIQTQSGTFKVWTKKFGNNPRIKILLLHGGPATGHEYMECFESYFPKEGFEFYEYDQLGASYSDQPNDTSLWTLDRYVEEVEQVRKAIGADDTNFYLLGNSWGGLLGMQYALKYQNNMKGLIVANMMASCPDYGKYANDVLAKQMNPKVLEEIRAIEKRKDFSNPRYMELLMPNFYKEHLCRLNEWPDAVNRSFKHMNQQIYTQMQGPSEFGVGGSLAKWDIKDRLKEIIVPTLMVGAKFDTMDPEAMEAQSKAVKNGKFLYCPYGSHFCMWDDQKIFMNGVINFIKEVDAK